jgi:hypothetical protein
MATGRIGTTPVLQVRWSKAPSAGTTSLSGLDDNSVSLVYSVGYEAVYRNGVLLSRTNDYTATDGTTVTLIDATIAGDIIEIFANQTIPLADTYSQTVANGKFINNTLTTTTGDIIYASAANTPARLAIGSTDQVLKVSGGVPVWATPTDTNGLTKIKTATFSNVANTGTTFDSVFTSTYNNYKVIFWNVYTATNAVDFRFQLRNGGSTQNTAYYGNYIIGVTKTDVSNAAQFTMGQLRNDATQSTAIDMTVFRNNNRLAWSYSGVERTSNYTLLGGGFSDHVASNGSDGFILSTSSGNIYGTVTVYGYEA